MTEQLNASSDPVTIKKYANRRLYNTATSSYVTLDHLSKMVKQGQDFQVVDAKSGADITRSVLTQIIFEEESKGQNLLPIDFLRQLIKFYGDSMQTFVPGYLQMSMEQFTRNRDHFRKLLANAATAPLAQFEEQIRQNSAIFEKALSMFSPFTGPATPVKPSPQGAEPESSAESSEISELKQQLRQMQDRLDAMDSNGGEKTD